MLTCVSDALIRSYKIASLSFAIAGPYTGMIEISFRLVHPTIPGMSDVVGRAVVEDLEEGEVFLIHVAGPAISTEAEFYIRDVIRELVNQLNKLGKKEESSIYDSYGW